jgi:putative component of membrane protein insertase Oxa1/YidC/SpoIIIJ protein YidD
MRFIRPAKPDHLSEEQHDRIAAKRIARFSPSHEHGHEATPQQLEARDHARLKALQKRQGRR